jgi:predicted metal-dependent hydrolase
MFLRYKKNGRTATRRTGLLFLQEHAIPYEVRESARARRVSLSIRTSREIHVVVPPRFGHSSVEPILHRHAEWILRTLGRIRRHESSLRTGFRLPLLGDARILRIEHCAGSRGRVVLTHDEVVVYCPESESDPSRLLTAWGIRWAKQALPHRTAELARLHGYKFETVTVRNQRTRWGSCSRRGGISLNWRLVLFPPEVADYLICHELAHLIHHNHSSRFWSEVGRIFPAWKESERWLRLHGTSLPL